MKDQELFTYFKINSKSFEEMPSYDLWNKIEQNLQQKPSYKIDEKSILLKLILLILIILTIVVMVFKKENNLLKKETLIKNDTVKKAKIIKNYDSTGTNQNKKVIVEEKISNPTDFINRTEIKPKLIKDSIKVISSTPLESKDIQLKIVNDDILTTKNKIIEQKKTIGFVNIIKDTTIITNKPLIVPTKAIQANNNIIFKTNKELSKEEYDVFLDKIKQQNKDSIGKTLIIKAKGYNTLRIIVKPVKYKASMIE